MNNASHAHTNNLINEKSPYLLQHSHNPVNWFPWTNEAFELAKQENKPIFLSIGYSTCHWCHVMEHESFEDIEVAKLMNEVFISIKVDREERPDIDNIYMKVCQMLTGSGGWPLTIIMTPDQKPFFAGTYFPKNSATNRIGIIDLIKKIDIAWKNEKDKIYKSANEITNYLIVPEANDDNILLNPKVLDKAFQYYDTNFDTQFGGFNKQPKFPTPHNLLFLLRYYHSEKNIKALEMVEKTLINMRLGGIFDQIGYGFHRYSTDNIWFLPHFEKMLYDQAMLIMAYAEAYQITRKDFYKQTVEEIITYVNRNLTANEGGFYSAEDADSEGIEGKFYLWEKDEITKLLGKVDAEFISNVFNIDGNGNYYEEASRERTKSNILHLAKTWENLANDFTISEDEFNNKIESIRNKLFLEREKKIHPYKDDKILTDWNGLMIAAIAKAARLFNNKEYAKIAENSTNFIFTKLVDNNGNLLHRFRDNDAAINAQIDDYAFLIWGLLELYETTFEFKYLQKSIELTKILLNDYWDKTNNRGFYFSAERDSKLITRPIEYYDGAIPSGNSVMFTNLQKLFKLTSDIEYEKYAKKLEFSFRKIVEKAPTGFSMFLTGIQFSAKHSNEIIIVGDLNEQSTKEIIDVINSEYIPNKVVLLIDQNEKKKIEQIAPYIKNYTQLNKKTTVYICENYTCKLPSNNIELIIKQVKSLSK